MANINVRELLAKAKELKAIEIQQRNELKAKKKMLYQEITSGISPEVKAEQLQRAKEIIATATTKKMQLKATFKTELQKIQAEFIVAKELIALVSHEHHNGLNKVKNAIDIEGNVATVKREGIKDITIDTSKSNWQITLKELLAKQNIENGIARNICYKVSTMLKAR